MLSNEPQVVVDKSILDKRLLPLLTDTPVMLPAWDPMGSLATVGKELGGGVRAQGANATDALARCRI